MAIIQVQIGKKNIMNVLLNERSSIYIITKQLKLKLRLPKRKPAPYDLRTSYQTITKLVGLIHDVKTNVHNIPYIITFTILQNNVINVNYSMLLGRPWFKDAKVAHDWGWNTMTIQGNGTIQTIV
jgi:hypothetical protein